MNWGVRLLLLSGVMIWVAVWTIPDDKLHVVFCNVGQGDATLISYRSKQILVDGGPNNDVLNCLARHMPFYDRKIDVVVLTHNNSDHSLGLSAVKKRYEVDMWQPKLVKGQTVSLGKVRYEVNLPEERFDKEIGDDNEQGIVGEIVYKQFEVLLTADVNSKNYQANSYVEVVKMPHHGSRLSVTRDWILQAKPKLAIISVGKNNFGHPGPEVLSWLNEAGSRVLRTDKSGDIEVVSDGKKWWVK